jgi:hypothetical protein
MKNSNKTGLTGNESESTTMVGTQDSTVNTVDVSSPDQVSVIPIDHGRIMKLVEDFKLISPEGYPYKPNLEDLESTVNIIKRKMGLFMKEVDDWFFKSEQEISDIYGNIHYDLIETSSDILCGLYSLQDDKETLRFDLNDVQQSLEITQYFQFVCCDKLMKKKTMDNIHLKRFLQINLEYELLLNQIKEKILSRNENKNFRNLIFRKICKCQSRLIELLSDIVSILNKKLSPSNRVFYNEFYNSILCYEYIPHLLFDHIFLSKEKGFDEVEMRFLDIFKYFEFYLEDYISVDTD